jgi:hypothetical protein
VEAEYHLLISADDLLAPGALAYAVATLNACRDAAFLHGQQLRFTDEVPLERDSSATDAYETTAGHDFIADLCSHGQNSVATPTVLVRTEAQRRAGFYDATLPHTADLHLWLRLALFGSVVRADRLIAYKRQHADNMQRAYLARIERDLVERSRAFDSFFDIAQAVPHVFRWRGCVRAALATESLWRAATAFDEQDVEGCARLQQLAATFEPSVRQTSTWRRMQIKRRIGPRVWRLIRTVTGRP